MTDVARILGEFIAAWNAGRRPELADHLERVPPADRGELADRIETFLLIAPEPAYSEAAWTEMLAHPAVRAVAEEVHADEAEAWPFLLPRLRVAKGLGWPEVAAALAGRLGFEGREAKAVAYLQDMESGQLQPRRVSRRLLDALADVLGVTPAKLDWRAQVAPAVFRAGSPRAHTADRLEAIADAMMAEPAPFDRVDELFLGGREAD